MLADDVHQAPHFVVAEEGWRTAAEVQLDDVAAAVQSGLLHGDLLAEILDVLGRPAVVLGDYLVAGAVIADGIAEGDVHV